MKLSKIFKKTANVSSNQKVQKLDKAQLEKVIGGTETDWSKTGKPSTSAGHGEVWNQPL